VGLRSLEIVDIIKAIFQFRFSAGVLACTEVPSTACKEGDV